MNVNSFGCVSFALLTPSAPEVRQSGPFSSPRHRITHCCFNPQPLSSSQPFLYGSSVTRQDNFIVSIPLQTSHPGSRSPRSACFTQSDSSAGSVPERLCCVQVTSEKRPLHILLSVNCSTRQVKDK